MNNNYDKTKRLLDEWLSDNYEKLIQAAYKNSGDASYAPDMLSIVIKDIYRQIEKDYYTIKYKNMIKTGKILAIFIGALKNQIQSNTSEGYRSLRRNLSKTQSDSYIEYINSGYTIEEHLDFENKLSIIESYLSLFFPIDVIIFKEVLINNKSVKDVCLEYNINSNYTYKAINYIKKGLSVYVNLSEQSQFQNYIKATELWVKVKNTGNSVISLNTKQELFAYYNILTKFEDVAANIYDKQLWKKVYDWFSDHIIIEENT